MFTRASDLLHAEEEAVAAKIVLIVSGQPGFLDHYRELLLECGFAPLTTTSSLGALACMRLVVLDLVIMDQSLSASEGQEILDRSQTLKECPPIIVVGSPERSGFCRGEHMVGTVEYLKDPVNIPDVMRVIASRNHKCGEHDVGN